MGMINLKSKMTLSVCLLVAGLISTAAFLTYCYFEREFKNIFFTHQFSLVSYMAREVDDKLTISQKVLQQTARRIPPELLANPQAAQEFLDSSREALSIFDDGLSLFSPEGKLIAFSPFEPNLRGNDYSFREYYKQTVASGRPYISNPYRSTKQHNNPAVMFTVPLFDSSGKLNGILTGSLNLMKSNLLGVMSEIKNGRTGYLYLFTNDRTLVVHPDRNRILKPVPQGKNVGIEKALLGFEGSIENVNSRGIAGITSFRKLRSADWIMAAHLPADEAYAPLNSIKHCIFAVLTGAVIGSIFISRWAIGYLTAPLLRFTRHVARIHSKEGEESFFRDESADDIGPVALTFNAMVAELDRQRAELSESKELYQIVADFSTDVAFWRSSEGSMRYISPNCCQMTGYSDRDFYDDHHLVDNIIHPDDRGDWLDHRKDTIDEIQPFPLEFRIILRTGEVRWVSHVCRTVSNEDGEVLGVRGSLSDINERKKMEDIVREQKTFVESLLQSAAVPIFVIDAEHKVIGWNRACEELTGVKGTEVIGTRHHWKAFYDHERPCLADIVLDNERENLSSFYNVYSCPSPLSHGLQAEGWYPRLGGKDRYVFFDAAPVRNGAGELVAAIEILQDITERKRVEEQIVGLRDYYLHLFQKFPALIWRSGVDAKCNYFNDTWLEFTGRSLEDEMHDGWAEGVHPDDMERCLSLYLNFFEARQAFTIEYRLRRHDGEYRWIIDHGRPFYDLNGDFAGFIGACYDITERIQIEEKLRQSQKELLSAYAELKEAQTQIFQKEKMASIGQLAAGVAHEINNPIGFITSNIGTLGKYSEKLAGFIAAQGEALARDGSPESRDALGALRQKLKIDYILEDVGNLIVESMDGADRVKKIVQDLKTFSRVDDAEEKVVNLAECIDSAINIARNELKYKVTLQKDYGDIPPVRCYPQQLNQVFLNLLVNAAHAIESQGTVTVRTWHENDCACVGISDTGCGIPEENRNRIFEPFFTTKDVGKGTGLGLSISYDIIKKHRGELSVDSEVGKGTTFTIRLPIC